MIPTTDDHQRAAERFDPATVAGERDAAVGELRRAEQRAQALTLLAHELAHTDDTRGVADLLAAVLPGILDCDASAVWLWDAERGEVRAAATAGLPPELHDALLQLPVRPGETPELAALLARREPLVLNAGSVTPALEQMLEVLGLRAAVGVALLSGERLLGAVTASWVDRALEGPALRETVQRLQGVADHAAIALLKAELVETARHQALHDALTGLPNRVLFHRRLEQALNDAGPGEGVAVLYCDLDRFKQVNDELGHAAGDEVLRQVAERLREAVPATATVGRLSGDEFAVLVPEGATPRSAGEVGERVVGGLEEAVRVEGRPLRLTISVGAAVHTGPGGRSGALLRSADVAMYDAKRRGRNQVVLARAGDRAPGGPAPSLAAELRSGIRDGELRLALQPIVRLVPASPGVAPRRVVGAEALVRWAHPRLGLLPPATFLSLAEDDGSVVALDLWMLRAACRAAAGWPVTDAVVPYVAVNLSVRTLCDERLHEQVRTALVEHDLSPDRLQVEVVESRALQDSAAVVDSLTGLRHLGVRVALDDFGTGFSTLTWLQRLPVDTIKVDRSFTADTVLPDDDRRRRVAVALLRGIVAVGVDLGVDVLVEGIETPGQLDAVTAAGGELAQGYLLGRPAEPAVLADLLGAPADRPAPLDRRSG